MKNPKSDIRTLTKLEIETFFLDHHCPRFRASQVYDWLWKHREVSFDNMTNLSLQNRNLLKKTFHINTLFISQESLSVDGTVKFLFSLNSDQNRVVEGVLIPQLNRLTACISSQIGCSLACTFCATGKLKLYRNLTAGEIYDQAFLINQHSIKNYNKPITNIVFMGMGEPLLNIKNVLMSIEHITRLGGMGMSSKRITLSTVGIAKIIKSLADKKPGFNLAISLHSAINNKRSKIMAINETNNLKDLADSLLYFYDRTKIKPTFEYVLLNGINDSIDDAKALVTFCKKIPSKVNLIEYNQIEDTPYQKSTELSTNRFMEILEKNHILAKLRRSRGEDIGAACGQLATQNKK